tara:strand:+ start:2138 stop:2665 length:528 start_codon:yes stop_codon:yes gene_type:complete
MTLEIIVFILAILFGIVWYWRESINNKLYRIINRITHTKDLQMAPDNGKGFVHAQPFLLRLVWTTLLFALAATLITLATPINAFFIQYFVSAIVGTLIGTYIASAFIFAKESTKKEALEKVLDKGKEIFDELTEEEDKTLLQKEEVDSQAAAKIEKEEPKPKSARDRLRDKGMIK